MKYNNSAARLHRSLKALAGRNPAETTIDALSKVLGVPDKNGIAVFRRLGDLAQLAEQTVEEVNRVPDTNIELYLAWRPTVAKAFQIISLPGQISAVIAILNDQGGRPLEQLQFCAEMLSKSTIAEQIEAEKVAHFRLATIRILNELNNADLDQDLKKFLRFHLTAILQGIDDFEMFGPRKLAESSRIMMSSIIILGGDAEIKSTFIDSPTIKMIRELITDICAATTFYEIVKPHLIPLIHVLLDKF